MNVQRVRLAWRKTSIRFLNQWKTWTLIWTNRNLKLLRQLLEVTTYIWYVKCVKVLTLFCFTFDDKKQLGVIFFNKSNEYTRKLNKSKQDLRKSQRSNQWPHLQYTNAWNEQMLLMKQRQFVFLGETFSFLSFSFTFFFFFLFFSLHI